MAKNCAEKTALLLIYTDRAKTYYEAVTSLQDRLGKANSLELEKLIAVAEEAGVLNDAARAEMAAHVAKHGC